MAKNGHLWGRYPPVVGMNDFREAVRDWLTRRYDLPDRMLSPDRHVLPVAGTKEALFMLSQLVTPESKAGGKPAVLMPNPFYNVYLGGAVVAGAEPVLLPVTAETGHLPDLDALDQGLLERTVAFFLCSPANPQGSAASLAYLKRALDLARRYDFLLIMDECYSEIYGGEPPAGGLQAALALGEVRSINLRGLSLPFKTLQRRRPSFGLRRRRSGSPQVVSPGCAATVRRSSLCR